MLDPYWQAAWDAMSERLDPRDRLLLPNGDWPTADGRARQYGPNIRIGDATVFALHKGRLPAIGKPMLRGLMRRWEIVFANEVFVCFRKPASPWLVERAPCPDQHVAVLHQHLGSRQHKRVANTVWLAHLPKTAGTTLWETLSQAVPSSIYYDDFGTFLERPPRSGDYDLVGGHVPLPLLLRHAGPDDVVAGLVRDPVARLRSAFLHSRRPHEDASTFSPMMRMMRERPLSEVLGTRDGQMEARLQFLMLGFDFRRDYEPGFDPGIRQAALAGLGDPRCRFDTVARIDRLAAVLAGMLGTELPDGPLAIRNGSPPDSAPGDRAEFAAALPQILSVTAADRELYELVDRRCSGR